MPRLASIRARRTALSPVQTRDSSSREQVAQFVIDRNRGGQHGRVPRAKTAVKIEAGGDQHTENKGGGNGQDLAAAGRGEAVSYHLPLRLNIAQALLHHLITVAAESKMVNDRLPSGAA